MPNKYVLPVIRREDYAAFRRDMGPALPNTHAEWAGLFEKEVASARREGKVVIETVIHYSEFARYCRAHGYTPDPLTLLDFTRTQKPLGEA